MVISQTYLEKKTLAKKENYDQTGQLPGSTLTCCTCLSCVCSFSVYYRVITRISGVLTFGFNLNEVSLACLQPD